MRKTTKLRKNPVKKIIKRVFSYLKMGKGESSKEITMQIQLIK